MEFANQLRFRNLFLLVSSLFVLDLLLPDMIPMLDEIILALLAIVIGNLKKKTTGADPGTTIEGEIIDDGAEK